MICCLVLVTKDSLYINRSTQPTHNWNISTAIDWSLSCATTSGDNARRVLVVGKNLLFVRKEFAVGVENVVNSFKLSICWTLKLNSLIPKVNTVSAKCKVASITVHNCSWAEFWIYSKAIIGVYILTPKLKPFSQCAGRELNTVIPGRTRLNSL